ncbi:phosphotransferase [Micromonospora sp. Llam7]|uniref:phosphotransferase family protein n=1 Tax=Micromonospora tarapacensis TaxID=2835305 RepID=UPI001C82B9D6|nr:phosphotransferase [Micromonospora tarapacensis]
MAGDAGLPDDPPRRRRADRDGRVRGHRLARGPRPPARHTGRGQHRARAAATRAAHPAGPAGRAAHRGPLARLRAALRLDASGTEPVLSRDDTAFLRGRVDELAQRYAAMRFPLGSGLIHNDAHPGNLVSDPSSRHGYRLADWEGACLGPRELDVVLVGAPGSRFGDPDHERLAFTAAYGYDIADWPDYQTLRDIRDLHSLAAYIRTSTHTPAALAELRRRVASLRDDDRTIQWVAV